jgi:hypothetical protein
VILASDEFFYLLVKVLLAFSCYQLLGGIPFRLRLIAPKFWFIFGDNLNIEFIRDSLQNPLRCIHPVS